MAMDEHDTERSGHTRKQFLQRGAMAAGAIAAASTTGQAVAKMADASAPPATVAGMNIVVFMTDQERHIQHFPMGWAQDNLPGLTALMKNGLTFNNAYTNACMCSPARSTFMSGYFPAQHGVKYTLEADMPAPQYPQADLPGPSQMANMATVASAAGYNVIYKGKWHCSKPAGSVWAPSDLTNYGFSRWNPQDAGANQSIPEMGGGIANNDGRYMTSVSSVTGYPQTVDSNEGVLQFINNIAVNMQPFCLIVSLVNPHDVLGYPRNYAAAGFDASWLKGDIGLPATVDENLATKPRAQKAFRKIFALSGVLKTKQQKINYLNFYGNLMRASDQSLVETIAALKNAGVYDNTLIIRTADHGEMGLAHGGLRQKNFNMYEESINVPLVFSNPTVWKKPKTTSAMVSHVDFLPTFASLINAPSSARGAWAGVDYSSVVLGKSKKPVQEYVLFTYDDFQAGQAAGPYVPPPQHVIAMRQKRWKIGVYWDPTTGTTPQWEMYDLQTDPLETTNIAWPTYKRTAAERKQFAKLRVELQAAYNTRLQPLEGSAAPFPTGGV